LYKEYTVDKYRAINAGIMGSMGTNANKYDH
jgi:hypothetical protein